MAETLDDVHLGVLADRCEGVLDLRHPYVSAVPDLAEAYLRQGRSGDAEHTVGGFRSAVGPGSPAPPRARALRLRGLLAPRGEYDDDFDTSVELDEAAGVELHLGRVFRKLEISSRTQLAARMTD